MKLTILKEINPVKEIVVELNKLLSNTGIFLKHQNKEHSSLVVPQINSQTTIIEVADKKNESSTETGNAALDLYCLEGMKLFNQGEYAKNVQNKKSDLGIYL